MKRIVLLFAVMLGVTDTEARQMASDCISCHRDQGSLGPQLPLIEGQNVEYLVQQIANFREAHRKGFPMQVLAGALPQAELQALASELHGRPWPTTPQRVDAASAQAGQPLAAALGCSGCHGPSYRGSGVIPRLAGQNAEYLARQLRAFNEGHRPLLLPQAALSMKGLSAAETNALAHYLASLDGKVHLDWLAGNWCSQNAGGNSEEWWVEARGGLMLGMHRDTREGRASGFEFLRIEIGDGTAVYQAQPGGRPPVPFQLVESGSRYAVFSNPQHDFPKRMRYQRVGNKLSAAVDDGLGNDAVKYEWTRNCATQAE